MIDRRLWARIVALADAERITHSEAINRLLWLGVIGRPNEKEKEEFCKQVDKISEHVKALVENGL